MPLSAAKIRRSKRQNEKHFGVYYIYGQFLTTKGDGYICARISEHNITVPLYCLTFYTSELKKLERGEAVPES